MAIESTPLPRFIYKGDRLKPLRAFCQVVRLGSISRAAEALYISQPAVTLQLQALEQALAVRLFERVRRRLTPTREGQMLYELARPLVEGLDALPETFRQHVQGMDEGRLDIAANSTTTLYLLPRIIARFRQQQPGVKLHLHNAITADGINLVRENTVDLSFGSMVDVPTDIRYTPIYRFGQVLITPPDHPLASAKSFTLAQMGTHDLILPPRRQVTWRLVDHVFQHRRVPYRVALEVDGWEVIKQYVAMGMGISIISSICLNPDDSQRLAIRPLEQALPGTFPPRSYGVITRKSKHLSPAARAFIALIEPGLFNGSHEIKE